jgi:hypothetical protein
MEGEERRKKKEGCGVELKISISGGAQRRQVLAAVPLDALNFRNSAHHFYMASLPIYGEIVYYNPYDYINNTTPHLTFCHSSGPLLLCTVHETNAGQPSLMDEV